MFLSFICFSKLVIFVNIGQLVENNTTYARYNTDLCPRWQLNCHDPAAARAGIVLYQCSCGSKLRRPEKILLCLRNKGDAFEMVAAVMALAGDIYILVLAVPTVVDDLTLHIS